MSGERRVVDIEAAIGDVSEAVSACAVELQALVEIERARALRELGFDPLRGSDYDREDPPETGEIRYHGEEPEAEPGVDYRELVHTDMNGGTVVLVGQSSLGIHRLCDHYHRRRAARQRSL